jgi:tetratricopeptide (TPR) repeat protein
MTDDLGALALTHFQAGEFSQSLEAARQGLTAAPDDVELLLVAGRAGVEVDADDAVNHLRRATELAPERADAWHYLGEALATDGRMAEADVAFRRAVQLDPDDRVALTHLGHTSVATGHREEGVGYLSRAADSMHGASTAAISLVDMYRSVGQYDLALEQARRIADAVPDGVLAQLDVAELSLATGQLDEARRAFERLRELDDVPGHESYPLHGMIEVEIRREQWEPAAELAAQAAAIDPYGLGTEVAAFLHEQTPGAADAPAPSRAEVDAALAASLADYRRMIADERRLSGGGFFG